MLYHVTLRGILLKPIYLQEDDFDLFLRVLADVCQRYNWVVRAYCLMTNHYHLLLVTLSCSNAVMQ
nr:transposase [Shewanella sediminis]